MSTDRIIACVLGGFILLGLLAFGVPYWIGSSFEAGRQAAAGNQKTGGGGLINQANAAPVVPPVGSVLPKDMVPGEWHRTGNTKVVKAGTPVDTSPKPCHRFGREGECALKKRGT